MANKHPWPLGKQPGMGPSPGNRPGQTWGVGGGRRCITIRTEQRLYEWVKRVQRQIKVCLGLDRAVGDSSPSFASGATAGLCRTVATAGLSTGDRVSPVETECPRWNEKGPAAMNVTIRHPLGAEFPLGARLGVKHCRRVSQRKRGPNMRRIAVGWVESSCLL